jgi:hypothetical protein
MLVEGTARTAGLLLAPVLAMTAIGCGNTDKPTEGSSDDRAAAAHASAGPAAGKAAPRCRATHLKADINMQDAESALVALTNKGNRTCTVNGYLSYSGLGADNKPINVSTRRVPYPGPPMLTNIKPGETAFSGLKWTTCNKADVKCKVLFGVTVTLPEDKARITATVFGADGKPAEDAALNVGADGFTTGSIQPSNQSVLLP